MREYVDATWGWQDEWQRDYFDKKFDPAASQVIQVNGKDAGVMNLDDSPEELYLALIEIAPEHQRQGLGTAIVHDLQAKAAQAHKLLALHVLKANREAQALYARLGFAIESEETHKYRMIWQSG